MAYDFGIRRKAQRKGRERGVSIFIPKEELEIAGFADHDSPIYYRVWGGKRGGVRVRLYKNGQP